jgi:O-antigen/teichoic acid export membrane protein
MRLKLLSDFYYNILKSNFIKNSFILLVSQLVAKILPLISLLFAVNLYSAEDFGKFGFFINISAITSSFANLALDNYIVLSKAKKTYNYVFFHA